MQLTDLGTQLVLARDLACQPSPPVTPDTAQCPTTHTAISVVLVLSMSFPSIRDLVTAFMLHSMLDSIVGRASVGVDVKETYCIALSGQIGSS